jgi:hypothetical protein
LEFLNRVCDDLLLAFDVLDQLQVGCVLQQAEPRRAFVDGEDLALMVAMGLFGGAADDACELAAARKTASVEANAVEFEVFVNWASH